ncbi:MAG: PD-(D/E)XK nuclease family protein [Paludibacteraceae bacterium]|nr:PD-(D/E)XK nuclease family protein [Paludibacteraceae bacterium]
MEENEVIDLLRFFKKFNDVKEKEEKKLPYHVNVIEELHIDENAHSRILLKFLMYKSARGEYEIFQSLLDYIIRNNKGKNTFKNIKIEKPVLTQEKARIDLWIRDEKYAIIFENKARNATDQESQLSRYIEETKKDKKYKNGDNIYVIYLPKNYKEPEDNSWGNYKDEFKERYFNMSFQEHVLPWLKNDVIPNVRQKDVYLSSALLQYVDYLEYFIFKTNEFQKNMNMALDKKIEDEFGFHSDDKIVKLMNVQKEIKDVLNQIDSLKIRYFEELYDEWRSNTVKLFPDLHPNENIQKGYWPITQVQIGNIKVDISGGHTDSSNCFYFGIGPIPRDKRSVLKKELGLKEENDNGIHEWIIIDEYNKVYDCFKNLVNNARKSEILKDLK